MDEGPKETSWDAKKEKKMKKEGSLSIKSLLFKRKSDKGHHKTTSDTYLAIPQARQRGVSFSSPGSPKEPLFGQSQHQPSRLSQTVTLYDSVTLSSSLFESTSDPVSTDGHNHPVIRKSPSGRSLSFSSGVYPTQQVSSSSSSSLSESPQSPHPLANSRKKNQVSRLSDKDIDKTKIFEEGAEGRSIPVFRSPSPAIHPVREEERTLLFTNNDITNHLMTEEQRKKKEENRKNLDSLAERLTAALVERIEHKKEWEETVKKKAEEESKLAKEEEDKWARTQASRLNSGPTSLTSSQKSINVSPASTLTSSQIVALVRKSREIDNSVSQNQNHNNTNNHNSNNNQNNTNNSNNPTNGNKDFALPVQPQHLYQNYGHPIGTPIGRNPDNIRQSKDHRDHEINIAPIEPLLPRTEAWKQLFLSLKIPPDISEEYATEFNKNVIEVNQGEDLTLEVLKDLNVKIGYALRILKYFQKK